MLRFRRYRVFLVFAALSLVFVIRLTHSRDWAQHPLSAVHDFPSSQKENGDAAPAKTIPPAALHDAERETKSPKLVQSPPSTPTRKVDSVPSTAPPSTNSDAAANPAGTKVVLPDRPPRPNKVVLSESTEDDIHPVAPPGRQELPSFEAVPTTIHWEKQLEHFPVPTGKLIKLPIGQTVKIPKIQYAFKDETTDAKISREKRQAKVKEEFKRAWGGYKNNAWMHDELSPVSGKFRDPFCGWAATLVDTLDTLWIMGLEEEFEDAVKGVEQIDFTTSPRSDIPVFETTIRYMGGLLAAYDVSGGKYKTLLDKAIELGEILIGAFDTPNRMPMLYYRWKPAFASQPHRASTRSSLAELGSLAMEFTRLSQLTKDPRYYDAIARVTDALFEWQDRGTGLDGVFPDTVDASGCNRTMPIQVPVAQPQETAIVPVKPAEEPIGYQPISPDTVREPKPKKGPTLVSGPETLEVQVIPGEPAKAKIIGWEDSPKKNSKRDILADTPSNTTAPTAVSTTDPVTGLPLDIPKAKANVGLAVGDWDCELQGLEAANAGYEKFSMGGGQDSTYEYFPKQYLLLGGLEDKYRKMYIKTVDAVRKHMLYRPMIPDMRDILFAGSVQTSGDPQHQVLSADVEHLTCFIGGMVGMGAKIFGLDGDIEIAKKLADGCVWAYESTTTGIMPEGGEVMACESAEHCTWNQTLYYDRLDPIGYQRDKDLEEYFAQKIIREEEEKAEAEAAKVAAKNSVGAEKTHSQESHEDDANGGKGAGSDEEFAASKGSDLLKKDEPASLQKRQFESPAGQATTAEKLNEKSLKTEAELNSITTTGRQAEVPLSESTAKELPIDPFKPLSHKEYVEARIEQEVLPPGYVNFYSKKYILRPEAIESVWYMYRITGDASWQNKGWKMFESIINVTSTAYGHSAIYDVTLDTPYQVDEMESFWLAETLKYFYLLFSTPDVISLDEWVLNTEAHPFKRPS